MSVDVQIITRKSMLYKTGVEYGDYAMNHVLGCAHGCSYPCYAYLQAKRFGLVKSLKDWMKPKLVSNTLALLDKELPRLKDKIKNVHLCFTTDPFMYGYSAVQYVSMKAIRKINSYGIPCTILTKGRLPLELSFMYPSGYSKNMYGITLVSLNKDYRKITELNTALYEDRIFALEKIHKKGLMHCKTWVSIEPYPTPNLIEQSLLKLLKAIDFVDRIVFGQARYNKNVTAYKNRKAFYNEQAQIVRTFCNDNNIECIIKKGTETE